MIHANRIVTVGEQESIIDRPIVLYRGDREVEIEFTLVGNEFTFSEEGNVIKSVNASHGQLVLNTPSGEHMFSELAECHEGKVVFVVTKEMIDEFIEMGFYSFQIRLYDSAEMKSRVTIPPVMNGFDIRNPIAAEDETNVVDQGIVDYARIFKDQSNEELPTFTWDGEYVKTEWAHHDVITENKLNKIEDALYSINANVKESDVVMLNALDNVKKDADKYVKEHMAEVEADVEEFERNLNTDVQQFKIDMNASVEQFKIDTNASVEQFKIDTNAAMTAHKNEVSSQLAVIKNEKINILDHIDINSDNISDDINSLINNINDHSILYFPDGTYKIKSPIVIQRNISLLGQSSKTVFQYTGTYTETLMFSFNNVKNVKISNFYFDGNNNILGAIKIENSEDVVIENNYITKFSTNSEETACQAIKVADNTKDIIIRENIIVLNDSIVTNRKMSVCIYVSSTAVDAHNGFTSGLDPINSTHENINIYNNTCISGTHGISLFNAKNINIHNNRLEGNNHRNIHIIATCKNINVYNNVCNNSGSSNIVCAYGNRNINIYNNTVDTNRHGRGNAGEGCGIEVGWGLYDSNIDGNNISNTCNEGIQLRYCVRNCNISKNTIKNNGSYSVIGVYGNPNFNTEPLVIDKGISNINIMQNNLHSVNNTNGIYIIAGDIYINNIKIGFNIITNSSHAINIQKNNGNVSTGDVSNIRIIGNEMTNCVYRVTSAVFYELYIDEDTNRVFKSKTTPVDNNYKQGDVIFNAAHTGGSGTAVGWLKTESGLIPFGMQMAYRAETSKGTIEGVEAELNALKRLLINAGIMKPS